MWTPLRIDHHGWQLAMLSLAMLGLVDRKRARGGILLGASTAVSLSIGLENAPLLGSDRSGGRAALGEGCARGAAAHRLRRDAGGRNRSRLPSLRILRQSGAGLRRALAGVAVDRRGSRRRGGDAASPSAEELDQPARRGRAVRGIVAAIYVLAWPHCLQRLEGVSPEVQRLWLDNVREARPIYRHNWDVILAVASLPIMGLIGYAVMIWRSRRDGDMLAAWGALAAVAAVAAATLLWQSRAGPAAQLLAVPGAAGIGWLLIPRIQESRNLILRVVGTVGAFMIISGLGAQWAFGLVPDKPSKTIKTANRADGRCPTLSALRPVALQPKGYVLTFSISGRG
jgi:hypothetical protein